MPHWVTLEQEADLRLEYETVKATELAVGDEVILGSRHRGDRHTSHHRHSIIRIDRIGKVLRLALNGWGEHLVDVRQHVMRVLKETT